MLSGYKLRLLIHIGISLIVVIIILISISLLSSDIGNKADVIAISRNNQNEKIQQLNNLAKLQTEREKALPDLAVLRNVFPKRDDLLAFPNTLDKIAVENNVGMQFSFGNEGEGSIQFDMVLQGSYNDIANFIGTVESGIIFIDIQTIDITGSEGAYRATTKGKIFFNNKI